MLKKIKEFTQKFTKYDIDNLVIVTLQSDAKLFERWCELNLANSDVNATRESLLEFIGVENELLRRGYGDEKGKIIPNKIPNFYKIVLHHSLIVEI